MLPGHKAPPTRTTLCAPMFERGTCWTDAPEPSDGGSAEATTRSNRCAIKLRQSAPSGPKRQPVGARPVLDGVRGPRVPSSGDRELRAPPYHQPRVWQCDPALLRCASPSAERVSRPPTRLSVTIRKLGVVLSSIPPDFARRTPQWPGITPRCRATPMSEPDDLPSARCHLQTKALKRVLNGGCDTSPSTRVRGICPTIPAYGYAGLHLPLLSDPRRL